MENQSSEEEDQFEKINLHSSIKFTHNKKLSFPSENKNSRKRSSSMSLNYINNFVPKLKPVQTKLCPSPINLNRKSPSKVPENIHNNKKISSSILEEKKGFNLKPIKYIYSRKSLKKKSAKILKIEEETHETEAISDIEDKSQKVTLFGTDSDSSKSDFEDKSFGKGKKNDILKNINAIREKLILIRKNSIYRENIIDDLNIGKSNAIKRKIQNTGIYQQKFIDKIRNNKNLNLNPLNSDKYRPKSFNIKQKYVPTILGFLEKNSSNNSLNLKGK